VGIWIELGIFVVVLAFGLWQIHDVGQERKRRQASVSTPETPPARDSTEKSP
jgi:hypothetical protein